MVKLAITVDDLPIHGKNPTGMSHTAIVDNLLHIFKKNASNFMVCQ